MPESPTGLIVAGIDGSAAAHCAARWAARDAERRNAILRLVHTVFARPNGGVLGTDTEPAAGRAFFGSVTARLAAHGDG